MDAHFDYRGIQFVWDEQKAAANWSAHRVHFEAACEVFFDPLVAYFDASAQGERRTAALGATAEGRLLVVVHMERVENSIRIISARRATTQERRDYEDE